MTTLALAALLAAPSPARAASAEESRLLVLANALRASVGAPALALDESLSAVARAWAAKMAGDGTISHNPRLTSQVGSNWTKVAENVGMGPDVDTVHHALMKSQSHYVNLVDTEVSLVGIGVVTSGRYVFIVEVFLQRAGAARPAPAPAPTTTTTPTTRKPAPAPAPTTTTTTRAPVVAVAAPATTVPEPPSPWLSLALEVTRGWERATG